MGRVGRAGRKVGVPFGRVGHKTEGGGAAVVQPHVVATPVGRGLLVGLVGGRPQVAVVVAQAQVVVHGLLDRRVATVVRLPLGLRQDEVLLVKVLAVHETPGRLPRPIPLADVASLLPPGLPAVPQVGARLPRPTEGRRLAIRLPFAVRPVVDAVVVVRAMACRPVIVDTSDTRPPASVPATVTAAVLGPMALPEGLGLVPEVIRVVGPQVRPVVALVP